MTFSNSIMTSGLLALLCFSLPAYADSPKPGMTKIPQSLVKNGELLDVKNNFSIKADQPNMAWYVVSNLDKPFTKYVGVNEKDRKIYSIFIDGRRYSEQNTETSNQYHQGLLAGFKDRGTEITTSNVLSGDAPRRNSYRHSIKGVFPDGTKFIHIEYVTSPDRLYAISSTFTNQVDTKTFEDFAKSFRYLGNETTP